MCFQRWKKLRKCTSFDYNYSISVKSLKQKQHAVDKAKKGTVEELYSTEMGVSHSNESSHHLTNLTVTYIFTIIVINRNFKCVPRQDSLLFMCPLDIFACLQYVLSLSSSICLYRKASCWVINFWGFLQSTGSSLSAHNVITREDEESIQDLDFIMKLRNKASRMKKKVTIIHVSAKTHSKLYMNLMCHCLCECCATTCIDLNLNVVNRHLKMEIVGCDTFWSQYVGCIWRCLLWG